jgi:hypothetical protein
VTAIATLLAAALFPIADMDVDRLGGGFGRPAGGWMLKRTDYQDKASRGWSY